MTPYILKAKIGFSLHWSKTIWWKHVLLHVAIATDGCNFIGRQFSCEEVGSENCKYVICGSASNAVAKRSVKKVSEPCDSAGSNAVVKRSVLSVFIDLRCAECVFVLWTSCMLTNKCIHSFMCIIMCIALLLYCCRFATVGCKQETAQAL